MDSEKKQTLAEDRSTTEFSILQTRNLVFLGFFVVLVLIFYKTLYQLLELSFSYHQHYSHIILIPIISLYFLITERKQIFTQPITKRSVGLIPIAAGIIVFMIGRFWITGLNLNDSLSLLVTAFLFFLWGIFSLVYGIETSRKAVFPLGFLIFLIPIPSALLEGIINWLLWGSTIVTNWLFTLTGIPFMSEGPVFSLPGLQIEIAEVCSGIRSSIALVITGVLAARLFLTTWWSKTLLLGALFPLAVFKNGVRIVSLSLLTIYVDEGFMTGGLHRKGGIFFFTLTLVLMGLYMGFLILVERWWKNNRNSS